MKKSKNNFRPQYKHPSSIVQYGLFLKSYKNHSMSANERKIKNFTVRS